MQIQNILVYRKFAKLHRLRKISLLFIKHFLYTRYVLMYPKFISC